MNTTKRKDNPTAAERLGVWVIYCIGFAIAALQLRSIIG